MAIHLWYQSDTTLARWVPAGAFLDKSPTLGLGAVQELAEVVECRDDGATSQDAGLLWQRKTTAIAKICRSGILNATLTTKGSIVAS